tara:strand:+ start:234 stop:1037 length:804 start_codon:yes stop_codon:yes gene_type:complete
MKKINRDKLIAEQLIREHIKKRISNQLTSRKVIEEKIRTVVRKLLEAETGTEEANKNTGINVLADLLKKIIPAIEADYKMLTSSPEQRESFKNHIVHAVKNTLNPIDAIEMSESIVYEIDPSLLSEKISIDLDTEDDELESVEGEFIDIEGEEEEEFGTGLDDQNETGRNFAADSFKSVEKQIVDAYDMLADDEDKELFYDYLLTNLLLYFDKFEDELAETLPDISTPEYEEEKAEDEAEEALIGDEAAAGEEEAEEAAAEASEAAG